jgi:hypothetical protein
MNDAEEHGMYLIFIQLNVCLCHICIILSGHQAANDVRRAAHEVKQSSGYGNLTSRTSTDDKIKDQIKDKASELAQQTKSNVRLVKYKQVFIESFLH